MLKVLIFVVVLAVPIFCATVGHKETAFQTIIYLDSWELKCYNVSGVDVDFERNDRIHLEYENCKKNAIDRDELLVDLSTMFPELTSYLTYDSNFNFTDQQKVDVLAFSRKYCPRLDVYLKCSDIMSPIYDECYNAEEIRDLKINAELNQHNNDFFCKNESEAVATLIDGKATECAMENKDALMLCYQEYVMGNMHVDIVDEDNPIFGMLPKADKLCSSIETFRQCVVPVFEQCELSPAAATLVKSFFKDVQTKTSCANITVINSSV